MQKDECISIGFEKFRNWVNEQLKRTDELATDRWKAGICASYTEAAEICGYDIKFVTLAFKEICERDWSIEGREKEWEVKLEYMCTKNPNEHSRYYY